MLNANSVGASGELASAINAATLTIPVKIGTGRYFDPGAGNHLWVTLRRGDKVERLKVIARNGDLLTVDARGADGTTAQSWAINDCIKVEWNPAMLCEFVINCTNGAPDPSGVTPGTYCFDKCTCLEIGADGRVTKITGGAGC